MASAKDWISAFRLRTLFLAASTVILGSGLALHEGKLDITIFIFAMILAVTIQILANLANDLGDFQKGTDVTGKRLGPTRAVQGGIISAGQMKVAIVVFVVLCILSGSVLVYKIAPYVNGAAWISLIFIGLLCIIAALFYTMGSMLMVIEDGAIFLLFCFLDLYLSLAPTIFIRTLLTLCQYCLLFLSE